MPPPAVGRDDGFGAAFLSRLGLTPGRRRRYTLAYVSTAASTRIFPRDGDGVAVA